MMFVNGNVINNTEYINTFQSYVPPGNVCRSSGKMQGIIFRIPCGNTVAMMLLTSTSMAVFVWSTLVDSSGGNFRGIIHTVT